MMFPGIVSATAVDGRRFWFPSLVLLAGLMGASAAAAFCPQPGEAVALVFPPWWSGPDSLVAAASVGRVVRVGRWPTVIVVAPDDAGGPRGGAWLVVNPLVFGGCGGAV